MRQNNVQSHHLESLQAHSPCIVADNYKQSLTSTTSALLVYTSPDVLLYSLISSRTLLQNAVAMELVTEKSVQKCVMRSTHLCHDQSSGGNKTSESERTRVNIGGTGESSGSDRGTNIKIVS